MTLPLVLAGPVVRRVDERFASFWIALCRPATVTAHVWPGIQRSQDVGRVVSSDPVAATGSAPTVGFGENLFVAVVTARAPASFRPGAVFSYDLSFVPDDGPSTASHLKSEGLLDDEAAAARLTGVGSAAPLHLALGYRPGQLPSFVTPADDLLDLRLAHASCRNPMGNGPDAMGFLDGEVEAHLEDAANRFQQLFLTGDQIYADDVPRSLFPQIAALGAELVGGAGERLPVAGQDRPLTLGNFPTQRRLRLVREEAGLSTTDGHCHLLGFGEFVAAHLVAWSTRVWRALATEAEVYVPAAGSEVAGLLTDWEACHPSRPGEPAIESWRRKETVAGEGETEPAFQRDVNRVRVYRASVGKAARLLANCATYMIFDDHEVTDDWNLNKRWRNRVVVRPLGRAILRNGLMAYTVCQAWGNDPRAFTRPDLSIFDPLGGLPQPAPGTPVWAVKDTEPDELTNDGKLLKLTHDAFAGSGPFPAGGVADLDKLLGLNDPDTASGTGDKAVFHYTVDGPKHRVVVLDTRTHRSYRGEGVSPPNLLGPTLDAHLPNGPFVGDQNLLVVVVPVPVLGPTLIHDIVQPVAALVQDVMVDVTGKESHDPCSPGAPLTGAEKRDVEGWNGDEPAMEAFLDRLRTYRSVVLLSGDVHFASSAVLDYWAKTGADPVARIVQLTSSGARNQGPSVLRPLVRALPFGQGLLRGEPVERLAWKGEAAVDIPDGTHIPPGRRARMLRKPALVPAAGWPEGTTTTSPPDWRWRARLLRDERRRAELPVSYPFQAPVAELDRSDMAGSLALVAARHATAALDRKDQMRVVVFAPNAGTVSFRSAADGLHVRHTLLSEASPASALGAPNTVHEAAITPPVGDPGPQLSGGA